jgi:hypothetical protein
MVNTSDMAGKLEYWMGLDVGQAADPSAVAVLKRVLEPAGEPIRTETRVIADSWLGGNKRIEVMRQPVRCVYHIVHLDRPPLRTPLPKIAEGVVGRLRRLAPTDPVYEQRHTVGLTVDATGVGRGVVDEIYRRIREDLDPKRDPRVRLVPANITGGHQSHRDEYGWWNVPKNELIFSGGVAPLQDGRLKWSKRIRERDTLEKERLNYRLNVNIATGHMTFEPWREGEHDDLLFAVCLAGWSWEKSKVTHVDTRINPPAEVAPAGSYTPLTRTPIPPRM